MVSQLLHHFGYYAVFVAVMVESLGVPVPGETMVITAAVYAGSTHKLSVWGILAAAGAAAIIGDNIGYLIGRKGGFPLLQRYGSKLHLDQGRLKIGRLLFLRHGGKIVFWGRFVSILRTYAAFLAGTNHMLWRRFLLFNAAGGITWAAIYSFGYYFAGTAAQNQSTLVDLVIGLVALTLGVSALAYAHKHEQALREQAEQLMPDDVAAYAPDALDEEEQARLQREARRPAS